MRIGIAQINPVLGDFKFNRDKILNFMNEAAERSCDLCVFPEASLFGYHPFDLLERKTFVEQQLKELAVISKKMPSGMKALVGVISKNPARKGKPYFNSAALISREKKPILFHKQLLPTGDVFDEARFIESGFTQDNFFMLTRGKEKARILVTICEDIWAWQDSKGQSQYSENPLVRIKGKVDFVVNMSASPYFPNKLKMRQQLVQKTAKHFKAPMIYVNMVGAQDEIIFDGGSFGVDKNGKQIVECIRFEEDLNFVDLETLKGGSRPQQLSSAEELRQALVLGIRDFCEKSGLERVHLGLSGGIDSAVVACLAVDALGPARVCTMGMPGPFNDPKSLSLAKKLAKNLQIEFTNVPISNVYGALKKQIAKSFSVTKFGLVHENLQARSRGILLMAFANAHNSMLLSTSNKSEYATGYATLYGDMCGGLAPIGDLTKDQVYVLANHYNQQRELIPQFIIDRPPSAELRPNQKDQDSLPSYAKLDAAVRNIVEECKPSRSSVEKWLTHSLLRTEFKRWQAPPVLKVSKHSFGRGRRFPIAHKASE